MSPVYAQSALSEDSLSYQNAESDESIAVPVYSSTVPSISSSSCGSAGVRSKVVVSCLAVIVVFTLVVTTTKRSELDSTLLADASVADLSLSSLSSDLKFHPHSSEKSSSSAVPAAHSIPLFSPSSLHDSATVSQLYGVELETAGVEGHRQAPRSKFESLTLPDSSGSVLNAKTCEGPYPGYPYCEDRMQWLAKNWNTNPKSEAYYRSQGVDGGKCSFLTFLNLHGFWCPEAVDYAKQKIRGVNIGGWLVLEPWIVPSLFDQFDPLDNVVDEWQFCATLGKTECRKQLEAHWDTWVSEEEIAYLATHGINHVRVPVGYWIMGDIRSGEPWVNGELKYLERFMGWCAKYKVNVVIDLHCAPGSQNGFDNSGKRGPILWSAPFQDVTGRMLYPNIERSLAVLDNLTQELTQPKFGNVLVAVELVNEAFISIPIEVVKDFYLRGYEVVKRYASGNLAVIIGDSFRFGSWNDFMFPPHYRHVWIDTHIYQCFDGYRLSMTWQDHVKQTCELDKQNVGVAPLSVMVGEWSLATTDCAKWLNGYGAGSRFDGTMEGSTFLGSCDGQNDITNTEIWTQEYLNFLREFAEKQMDAYESGSSAGWFFWNFKTENAPQWNYILGLQQGWIPADHERRTFKCDTV